MDANCRTELGTPVSAKWDSDWVAEVEGVEKQLGRRVCGAHSPAWTPCTLGADHSNGRCRYHGGHSGIGAPLGNRNAMIHGLYSRRLQQCGSHCPLWETCPLPTKELEAMPRRERPYCPYEKAEYDFVTASLGNGTVAGEEGAGEEAAEEEAIVAGAASAAVDTSPLIPLRRGTLGADLCEEGDGSGARLALGGTDNYDEDEDDGDDLFSFGFPSAFSEERADEVAVDRSAGETLLHHNIATFQVMLTRAQAALGWSAFTEETRAEGERYSMRSSKVGALLQAQLRIARELRQWVRLLATDAVRTAFNIPSTSPAKGDSDGGDGESERFFERVQSVLKKGEGVFEEVLELERREAAGEIDPGLDTGFGPALPDPA